MKEIIIKLQIPNDKITDIGLIVKRIRKKLSAEYQYTELRANKLHIIHSKNFIK